ncbi:hypothetical protein ACLMAL_16115 [Nocardia sp. CWNU-33]|uniref:hypothetical protein n=1 Tax=Nocardia sp. CWNU-33 TaxID=3392117 RepID=UPI00398E5724
MAPSSPPTCPATSSTASTDAPSTLAAEDGIPFVERTVDLTELYIADEVFVSGTSAGAAPVTEVDGRLIADGRPGPISQALRKRHAAALRTDELHGWVTNLAEPSV